MTDASYFRVAPGYELVPFDRLEPEKLAMLGSNPQQSGFAAAFIDESGHRPIQAVGSAAIDEISRLATGCERTVNEILAALVLSGVVEIFNGRSWVTAMRATSALGIKAPMQDKRLHLLERRAFSHARRCGGHDLAGTASRLYFSNRIPVTRRWRERWPDSASIARDLGVEDAMSDFKGIHHHRTRPWLVWHRNGAVMPSATSWTAKLYVSPLPQDLPAALEVLRAVLPDSKARAIKIGADTQSLLRPDKCIVYFQDIVSMQRFGDILRSQLAGMDGHGVPFTAPLQLNRLLSWGADPPLIATQIGHANDSSWRLWVCNRIASAIHLAYPSASDSMVWRYACASLNVNGINVAQWSPTEITT